MFGLSKLQLIGLVVIATLAAVGTIYYKGSHDGGTKNELKHERANNEATKRKDAVVPADSLGTIERLRAGSF